MRLIDADEIKKIISKSVSEYSGEYTTDMINMWGLFTQIIDNAPTVIPEDFMNSYEEGYERGRKEFERPTGKWIWDGYQSLYCTACKEHIYCPENPDIPAETRFCPNCGAKMKRH